MLSTPPLPATTTGLVLKESGALAHDRVVYTFLYSLARAKSEPSLSSVPCTIYFANYHNSNIILKESFSHHITLVIDGSNSCSRAKMDLKTAHDSFLERIPRCQSGGQRTSQGSHHGLLLDVLVVASE